MRTKGREQVFPPSLIYLRHLGYFTKSVEALANNEEVCVPSLLKYAVTCKCLSEKLRFDRSTGNVYVHVCILPHRTSENCHVIISCIKVF